MPCLNQSIKAFRVRQCVCVCARRAGPFSAVWLSAPAALPAFPGPALALSAVNKYDLPLRRGVAVRTPWFAQSHFRFAMRLRRLAPSVIAAS